MESRGDCYLSIYVRYCLQTDTANRGVGIGVARYSMKE